LHHLSQLFVLIFPWYHRKTICALFSKVGNREAFVSQAFETLNKFREAIMESSEKSGKYLKESTTIY
jgi:hypothetical protein